MELIKKVAEKIHAAGGRVFMVGGCVRDKFMDKVPKDIDVEIFGLPIEEIINILSSFGQVDLVGKSFGILKIKGMDYDFAVPRRERNTGFSHKAFEVSCDPFMSYKEACERRDFTINAMMEDMITGEVLDYFGGHEDIRNGVIRHIKEQTFAEDPLRVYRAVQFAARFGFTIAPTTIELCRSMDLSSVSKERIYEEISKALLKASKPSIALEYMKDLGIIEKHFPLLNKLIGCEQPANHHPEGDVWNHTMLVLDEAAKLRNKSESPESFMLAALTHDIGKPDTQTFVDGVPKYYEHHSVGAKVAVEFLKTLTAETKILDEVSKLVYNHMKPIFLYKDNVSDSTMRRFAAKCNVKEVLLLHEADHKGRGVQNFTDFENIRMWFEERINRLSLSTKPQPLVMGRDLIALGFTPYESYAGLKKGEHFRVILNEALEMQLDGMQKQEILTNILTKYSSYKTEEALR